MALLLALEVQGIFLAWFIVSQFQVLYLESERQPLRVPSSWRVRDDVSYFSLSARLLPDL